MNNINTKVFNENNIEIAAQVSQQFSIGKRTSAASAKLLNAIKFGKYKDKSGLITFTGPSGAGKTTTLQKFCELHPELNIISTTVYSHDTVKDVGKRILEMLNDPLAECMSSRGSDITKQIQAQVRACNVDLIIIDESQHLKVNEGPVANQKVGKWIKQAAEVCGVPVLLAGLPDLDDMFKSDLQLRRRRILDLQFPAYDWQNENDRHDWCRYLFDIEKQLPFTFESNLYNTALAEKIYRVSNGLIGSATQLLEAATLSALEMGRDQITLEDLSYAFETNINNFDYQFSNPFK